MFIPYIFDGICNDVMFILSVIRNMVKIFYKNEFLFLMKYLSIVGTCVYIYKDILVLSSDRVYVSLDSLNTSWHIQLYSLDLFCLA